jgi:type VI secretion system protein ImpK
MRMLLVDEGNRLATRMTTLHPTDQILLVRSGATPIAPPVPAIFDKTQLERIAAALAGEPVEVASKGEFIQLNVNNVVLFDSGRADVKAEFAALAAKIAAALDPEPGPILILGHTDNVPLSGRGRFKDNYELSVARAQGVADVLVPLLSDAARVTVEGKGELEPVADNGSAEGRADNRRVEILIQREDTL